MGRRKEFVVEGVRYRSMAALARAYKLDDSTVSHRISQHGWTPEESVGVHPSPAKNKKRIIFEGIEYESINALARAYGLDPQVVHNRLKRDGRKLEEALSKKPLKRRSGKEKEIRVGDLVFSTLKEAADHYKISYGIARYRIGKHWKIDQVFGLKPPPKNKSKNAPKEITFRRKKYSSISKFAENFGQNESSVIRRLKDGWSLEEAAGLKEVQYHNRPKAIIIKGKKFKSRNEAARFYGINIGAVATRVNKQGWTIEQALELEPRPEGSTVGYGFVYLIKHKRSKKAYLGITRQNLETRLEQHVSVAGNNPKPVPGGLHEAIKKFGTNQFQIKSLAEADTISELEDLERLYIKKLNTLKPNGYNLSKGGSMAVIPGRSVEVKSLGLKFESASDAGRYFDIQPSVIIDRLNKGYTVDQAVGLKPLEWVSSRWHPVTIDGVEFKTIADAAKHYGNKANRVRNRIHDGWGIEDAVKTPFSGIAKRITIKGVEYPSIRAAARALGIPHDTLRARIKSGRDLVKG